MTTKTNVRKELQIVKKLEKLKKEIGDRRDRLSELQDELETLGDSCGDAEQSLEVAIDSLSQYV